MPTPAPLPDDLPRAFTISSARDLGVSRRRTRNATLSAPFYGVREQRPAESLLELCHSYAARMRPDEFFSSATAALLHGIPLPLELQRDPRIHVAVPNPRRAPRAAGVVGHKFVVQPARGEVVLIEGLRVSSPARAWCELAPLVDDVALVVAGDHIARAANGLGGAAALLRTLEHHPARRTRKRLEDALGRVDGQSESPMETELRLVLVDAGISGFRVNLVIPIPGTGRTRRLDIAFEREKVALEYQGSIHHDIHRWRDDMTRISQLESLGWTVVQINAADLANPEELVARIRRILKRARE